MVALTMLNVPAYADDAKTGFFAGLGFSAADGKTSLGTGAGTIEAALLASDAFLETGGEIRALADQVAQTQTPKRSTVLLLGGSDTLDFSMARWVGERLSDLNTGLPTGECHSPKVRVDTKTVVTAKGKLHFFSDGTVAGGDQPATATTTSSKSVFDKSDLAPAVSTSINVSGITLTANDRLLVDAVQIAPVTTAWRGFDKSHPGDTLKAVARIPTATIFKVPGETVDFEEADDAARTPKNEIIRDYRQLKSWSDQHRDCDQPAYKAALDRIDTFDKSINASDKGPPPLAVAAELAPLARDNPLVLRLAVEQVGGSAVSRSNIWYAAGFPGAATVSAGLLVSFRLSDPIHGTDLLAGFVRCAVRPTGLRDVRNVLKPDSDLDGAKLKKRVKCGILLG